MFTVLYLETRFYLELFRIVFIVHNVGILTKYIITLKVKKRLWNARLIK